MDCLDVDFSGKGRTERHQQVMAGATSDVAFRSSFCLADLKVNNVKFLFRHFLDPFLTQMGIFRVGRPGRNL